MRKITTVFFDLDDTLYSKDNGLWEAIRERMGAYMENLLSLPPEEVAALRRYYYKTYGTTLRGLQMHHEIDSSEYLAYVHDLPLDKFLCPDHSLQEMLKSLPLRKYILTNADSPHAQRVLDILGVNGCFEDILDVVALGYLCKPQPEAFSKALELAGMANPQECLYLDDSTRNLA
ncbi:MAG: pyrimidine 5'-nucleotidase, partial [bacterium]